MPRPRFKTKLICTHASVVLFIFHYCMLQNKQSNRHSLYSMTSAVVLFAYPIKFNISTGSAVTKILPKKYCYFNRSSQCNQQNVGQKLVS